MINRFTRAIDPLIFVAAGLFVLYLLIVRVRPVGYFWTIDEGGKLTYLQSVIRTGDPSAPLLYPLRSYDPEANFVPLYFRIIRGDQFYTWWLVGFPLLVLPLYRLVGWLGLYVIPALSGAASAYLTVKIIQQESMLPGWLTGLILLLTGLATPIAFYSVMFWEHTLAVCLALASIYVLLRLARQSSPSGWQWAVAGILASLAVFFRTETGLFLAGAVAVNVFKRPKGAIPFGLVFALISAIWMAFNNWATGSPVNIHIAFIASNENTAFPAAGAMFFPYLLFNSPGMAAYEFSNEFLIAGSIITIIAATTAFSQRLRAISVLSMLCLIALLGWAVLLSVEYRTVSGFLLASPQVVFAIWYFTDLNELKSRRLLWMIVGGGLLFFIIYVWRSWNAAGGWQWGPRYLLVFYPLFTAIGAAGTYRLMKSQSSRLIQGFVLLGYIAAILISLGMEARGIWSVQKLARYTADTDQAMLRLLDNKPVVSHGCEIAMLIPTYYWEEAVFSTTRTGFEAWANQARQSGFSGFYWVTYDLCSFATLGEIDGFRRQHPGGMTVLDCQTDAVITGGSESCRQLP